MADEAVERYRTALRAWSAPGPRRWPPSLAARLAGHGPLQRALIGETAAARAAPTPCAIALRTVAVSRALERIADHTAIIGSRLRYLITGEPGHLAAEVR